jgi:hypothetical protein
MNRSKKSAYAVGYGKPPESTRFKPGQSGNAKGRPKGAKNLSSILERSLREKVTVTENGKRRTISKAEAVTKRLIADSLSGKVASTRTLMSLLPPQDDDDQTPDTNQAVESERDLEILKAFLARQGLTGKEEKDD